MAQTNEQFPAPSNPDPWHVHVLVVEDDIAIQKMLRLALEKMEHRVSIAGDGNTALEMIRDNGVELVLLDIVLPDIDGFDVCGRIRTFSEVPVLMVTALNRTEDIVHGFEVGADDYITKPFSLREIQGRIHAILRRIHWIEQRPLSETITNGTVQLNIRSQRAVVRGREVHLTPIEFRLLRQLMLRPDQPISKQELFHQVWGYEVEGGANLVEVAIRRLRSKIEESPSDPKLIATVHAIGYKYVSPAPDGK